MALAGTPPIVRTGVRGEDVRFFIVMVVAALVAAPVASSPQDRGPSGPLPFGKRAVSTHAPYASQDCIACHVRQDGYDPGPLREEGDSLCFSCHEDVEKHSHAFRKCSKCHNAHDSMRPKLLKVEADACLTCHDQQGR